MAGVGASGSTAGWSDAVKDWLPVVDQMIAAANSIPEGAPVGTIARRSDGLNVAFRTESGWHYALPAMGNAGSDADSWPVIFHPGNPGAPIGTIAKRPDGAAVAVRVQYDHDGFWGAPVWSYMPLNDPELFADEPTDDDEADSWPVIYDPDEYHEGDKPRLERLMREPSVFDADPHGTVNLDGTLPTFTPDPTAQQEPCCGVSEVYDCDCPPAIRVTPKPRELPSLDCEEARDGTVWEARYVLIDDQEQTPGWKFRYTADGWVHDDGHRVLSSTFLTDRGPYTEVIS